MSLNDIKLLGAEDLAPILRRAVSTIRVDARRRPQTLPPRFRIPGSSKLLWLEADVLEWIEEQRKQGRAKK